MYDRITNMLPVPIVDAKEENALLKLQRDYEKLIEPSKVAQLSSKALNKLPNKIKLAAASAKETLSETELMTQAIKYAGTGFKTLEEYAARITISEKTILKSLNKHITNGKIDSLSEVCFARAYDIEKLVTKYKTSDVFIAAVEGAGTGALGFAGLVPNLVLSTFLYFRAVQSVAMCYGYDVKNDFDEMEIASGVFMNSLSPGKDAANNELNAVIGKFMVFTETTAIRQTSRKTWSDMISRGGTTLFIAQMRALAHKSAEKALQNAGVKGFEKNIFNGILQQIGKKATLKSTGQAMPVLGGVFGALFDTAQMNKIINYADIFYRKRFIEEKEVRINSILNLFDSSQIVIDVEEDELDDTEL